MNGSAGHSHDHHSHGSSRSHHRKAAPDRLPASYKPSLEEHYHTPLTSTFGSNQAHNHSHSLPANSWVGSRSSLHQQSYSFAQNSPNILEPTPEDMDIKGRRPTNLHPNSHSHGLLAPAYAHGHLTSDDGDRSKAWLRSAEAVAAIIIPLPFVLTLLVLASEAPLSSNDSTVQKLKDAGAAAGQVQVITQIPPQLSMFSVSYLTAVTLLVVGIVGEIRGVARTLENDKSSDPSGLSEKSSQDLVSFGTIQRVLGRILSVGLPYYATSKIGGERVATILLTALAGELMSVNPRVDEKARPNGWRKTLGARKWTVLALAGQIASDISGLTAKYGVVQMAFGYLAITISVLFLPLPYPTTLSKTSIVNSPMPSPRLRAQDASGNRSSWQVTPVTPNAPTKPETQSPMISTPRDTDLTIASGVVTTLISFIIFFFNSEEWEYPTLQIWIGGVVIASLSALALMVIDPQSIWSQKQVGLGIGLASSVIISQLLDSQSTLVSIAQGILACLSWIGIGLDNRAAHSHSHSHSHTNRPGHSHDSHSHSHSHSHGSHSRITEMLLSFFRDWPLLHSILIEKDSRRILYFMWLNFGFMLVQTFYGLVTGSLGLLSDSIHMLFDCLALVVGLCAAVMSKWPPSLRFPYGFGKMDTLAGFANGVFLMLISIEIIYEAVERLVEGSQMQRIGELLTVSSLGLLVNLVGMMAFGHAHHGHGHSHGGHDHDHSPHDHHHDHNHDHNHENSHNHHHDHHDHHHHHNHSHTQALPTPSLVTSPLPFTTPTTPSKPPVASHAHSHGHHHHDHSNENMHGIFLHVLADTLGSVAVVISTILIHYTGWVGWDPLASCLIAILIFASAIPLVSSSAKRLLLAIPESTEFDLREALSGVGALKGVVNVCVPKFWIGDSGKASVGGVMHVIVGAGIELDDVRERAISYLRGKDMDILVQVEREGEGRCWCGGGQPKI